MTRRPAAVGERVSLRLLGPDDQDAFIEAVQRSRRLHRPWSSPPDTPEGYRAYSKRSTAHETFGVFRNDDDALVGVVGLSQIFGGRFRSAFLGYFAFTPYAGKGYLREAIDLVTRYGFDELDLHRIQANIQPGNVRSTQLMRAAGFRLENESPRYLDIDGWRDHRGWVLLADGPPEDEVLARSGPVTLHRVTSANWRDVAAVKTSRPQGRWIADVTRYLTRCRYGGDWFPLAIRAEERVVGFAMWAHDPDDIGAYWIGGFMIDRKQQRKGYGRAALAALIRYLRTMPGCRDVVLSYMPDNEVAKRLYAETGFVETGETEDDEVVARLRVRPQRRSP